MFLQPGAGPRLARITFLKQCMKAVLFKTRVEVLCQHVLDSEALSGVCDMLEGMGAGGPHAPAGGGQLPLAIADVSPPPFNPQKPFPYPGMGANMGGFGSNPVGGGNAPGAATIDSDAKKAKSAKPKVNTSKAFKQKLAD